MKNIRRILCCIIVFVLVVSSGCSFSGEDGEQETQNPVSQVDIEETTSKYPDCPVNLMDYRTKNMEVYAYIDIPGTRISYPVVQSRKDDVYYLRRNWMGAHESSGCIFSQSCNAKDFTDPITVLYGHNTNSGKMFSELMNYKDPDFFAENNIIYVYVPYGVLVYRIFSAHSFDDRHIINSYDFSNPEVLADFQQYLLDPPVLEKNTADDVVLTPYSYILTLSTCAEPVSGCNARYLVNGVLIDYVLEDQIH